MRHSRRSGSRPRLVILALALGVILAACAGSAPAPFPDGDSGGEQAAPTTGPSRQDDGSADVPDDARIVYTGSLQLVVPELQAALARARAEIAALGGYVGASFETNGDGGSGAQATITYRIPSARWSDGLAALRALATEVVYEETKATDIGAQLVDIEARLKNLRASEVALQEIAAGATKVTDLLEVERRLTELRGQIESLDAQRARLADEVAYGTLTTSFGTDVAAVSQAAEEWDPAREADQATATLLSVVQRLASGAIWFTIVWLPFLAVLAVVALAVRWAVRRYQRRHGPNTPRGPVAGWGEGDGGAA
jgi:hypothetical protein